MEIINSSMTRLEFSSFQELSIPQQYVATNCRVNGWSKNIKAPAGRNAYRIETICKTQAPAGAEWKSSDVLYQYCLRVE